MSASATTTAIATEPRAAQQPSPTPHPQQNSVATAVASIADTTPQAILQREQRAQSAIVPLSDQDVFNNAPTQNGNGSHATAPSDYAARPEYGARGEYQDRTPPRSGIAPEPTATPSPTRFAAIAQDLAARSGLTNNGQRSTDNLPDRGLYAPAEAMRAMYDMGDAPSCATCGAIMTRSGSCYRCMSCGSTSGCS
jgi:ribonucleoside-diphosphate reductase alpha chain